MLSQRVEFVNILIPVGLPTRVTAHAIADLAADEIIEKLREGQRAGMPAAVLANAEKRMIEYYQRPAHRCVYCTSWVEAKDHRHQFLYQLTPPAFIMIIGCPSCTAMIERGDMPAAMQRNAEAYAGVTV